MYPLPACEAREANRVEFFTRGYAKSHILKARFMKVHLIVNTRYRLYFLNIEMKLKAKRRKIRCNTGDVFFGNKRNGDGRRVPGLENLGHRNQEDFKERLNITIGINLKLNTVRWTRWLL